MKISKTIFLLVSLLFSISVLFAQDSVDNENWIGKIEYGQAPYLIHSYRNYTQADVVAAKQKFILLKQISPMNEWEGMYDNSGHTSDTKLIWNSQVGFIGYYVNTCSLELSSLDFGYIKINADQIELFSEKTPNPESKNKISPEKFVKVKWGDVHYLVEEDELETFCELAAGYYGSGKPVETEIDGEKFTHLKSIWEYYWQKVEEPDKKVFGLPILPNKYKHLVKIPIESEILAINEHKLDLAEEDFMSSTSYRYVTISVGKNKNIKPDMEFYIPDLQERIKIIEVGEKTSKGVIERWFEKEENREDCRKDGQEIPCQNPKVRMKVKTVPDEFLRTD
ncbi:hypothetical protein BH20ACI4_BH20ACI4_31920 [soil metagenome]